MSFRLTYGTMFNPPEAMHERFEAALATVQGRLGQVHALFVDGRDRDALGLEQRRSPINSELTLGRFPLAGTGDIEAAFAAAEAAYPLWRSLPVKDRANALRRVADVMEQRVYDIAAVLVLEVGKNRMEALGETQETVDFFRHYADDFESHGGYEVLLPDDPMEGVVSHNRSVLRPYGVWSIIAPFNFPLALAGGPTAAALITGNTVVLKCASDTPWSGRLLADCIRDAGLPPGVFNYLAGGGATVGEAMVRDRRTAGVTFTGSAAVGRSIQQQLTAGAIPKPLHRRDGWEESVHRDGTRGPRPRCDRNRALGLRHGRAEVLCVVPPLRRPARRGWTTRAHREAHGWYPDRRPAPARELARPCRQCQRVPQLRALRR
jgi:1-pyrroline-5-carboxylate dehydrogenase